MRYYTNGTGGFFSHHVLLSDNEIESVVNNSWVTDLYCSVQRYNMDGTEKWSHLVFDIDSENIYEAYDIAKSIAYDVEYDFDTDVQVWFSGKKGFHVVTGLIGYGLMANIAMKGIALNYSDDIDVSMYKSRSMFRLPNSINSKTMLHKIQVKEGESVNKIKIRAKHKQPYDSLQFDWTNKLFIDQHTMMLKKAVFDRADNISTAIIKQDWYDNLVPCLKKLLSNGVPSGSRWKFAFMLVKHWRQCGVPLNEALNLSHNYDVFRHGNYTESMIRHYYNNEIVIGVGCKSSELSDLMLSNCSIDCTYNNEGAIEYATTFERNFWNRDREK